MGIIDKNECLQCRSMAKSEFHLLEAYLIIHPIKCMPGVLHLKINRNLVKEKLVKLNNINIIYIISCLIINFEQTN